MYTKSPDKLILALDGLSKKEAMVFVKKIPNLKWVKVGLELFLNGGIDVLKELKDYDKKIFLDLKFHDIPVTMRRACSQAARLGSELISIHSCAGLDGLKAAHLGSKEGAALEGLPTPTLLAVTVLTSWSQQNMKEELALEGSLEKRVEILAKLALEAGIGGCVCSPLELLSLRKFLPDNFQLVTPGIRNNVSDLHDQSRVMKASEAIKLGASRIVVGRPITQASDPVKVFAEICESLE
tara:strand:+ start:6272 stop:6988 length:717 start_codon:yes stop_codon:yes gene_type:complete